MWGTPFPWGKPNVLGHFVLPNVQYMKGCCYCLFVIAIEFLMHHCHSIVMFENSLIWRIIWFVRVWHSLAWLDYDHICDVHWWRTIQSNVLCSGKLCLMNVWSMLWCLRLVSMCAMLGWKGSLRAWCALSVTNPWLGPCSPLLGFFLLTPWKLHANSRLLFHWVVAALGCMWWLWNSLLKGCLAWFYFPVQ